MRTKILVTVKSIRFGFRVLIFGFALSAGIMVNVSNALAQIKFNRLPVANAGPRQTIALPVSLASFATATLNGSASADPDGDPLTYQWRDAAGNVIGTTATVTVRFLAIGHYAYVLTVNDGRGATSSDSTFVNVVTDTTPPVVYPPADLVVGITETGGARGSASSDLAAFLVGAKALDNFDHHPSPLPPQVGGVNADNNTFFPEGSTLVTFSFADAAGNIGSASAKVTVIDLQSGDLFVGGASVADSFGNYVGGIFRVRGGAPTLYCQPASSSTFDPRFWNIPQDVMLDKQGRVVFVAYLGSLFFSQQGWGLFRCGSLGATPELLAVFPGGAGRPVTDPIPFGSMLFGAESGMHMEEVREVIINDLNTVPKLVTEDVYALALAAGGVSSPTGFIKSARFHPTSAIWDDGPDLGTFVGSCINGFQCLMPDIAFHSGTTYVAGGGILRRNKIPLRIDASGKIFGTSFQLSLGLFGSAGDLNGTILHDSSFPTVSSGCTPAPPIRNDMPLVNGTFGSLSGVHEVIYDEYNGFGLVVASGEVSAIAPYLTNISEALLDNPDPSLFFQDNFIGCVAVPELDVSSPLPFFGVHGINGSSSLVSAPNGVFGVVPGAIVQMAPGVDATDQRVVAPGLPIVGSSGLGAWPPKLSAGISADLIIRVDSPVNVLLTDAGGKRIGVDSGGNPVNDFGHNGFDSGPGEPRFFAINNPFPGAFQVQAVGTGVGTYTVHVYTADFSLPVGQHILTTGTTSVGATSHHDFTMAADYTVAFLPTDIPIANAGADQTVTADSTGTALATLNGSASSDPLGTPLAFLWAGPFGALTGAVITPRLPAGTYVIKLTVDNGVGGIASANVTVTVNPSAPPTCATDVSGLVFVSRSGYSYSIVSKRYAQTITLKNAGSNVIIGPISLVLDNLSSNATLFNAGGATSCALPAGSPYVTIVGPLNPGASTSAVVQFTDPTKTGISYTTRVLAGGGNR